MVITRNLDHQQSDTKTHLIYHGRGRLVDTDTAINHARSSGGLRAVLKNVYGDDRQTNTKFVSLPGFKTLPIDTTPTRDLTRRTLRSNAIADDGIFAPRTRTGETVRLGKSIRRRGEQATTDKIIVKKGLISGDSETRRKMSRDGIYLRNQKSDKKETLSLRDQLAQLKAMESAARSASTGPDSLTGREKLQMSIFDESVERRESTRKTPPRKPDNVELVQQVLPGAKLVDTALSREESTTTEDEFAFSHEGHDDEHPSRYLYYVREGDTLRSIFQEQIPREAGNQPLFTFFVAMNDETVRLNSELAADGMTLIIRPGTVIKLPTPRQIADLERG